MGCGDPQTGGGTSRSHRSWSWTVAFSPDGKTLATCGADDSIKFWDTTTWKEIPPSLGQKEYVSSLAFSPNGRTLATACADGTMKLWNVATRREVASLKLGLTGLEYHVFSRRPNVGREMLGRLAPPLGGRRSSIRSNP